MKNILVVTDTITRHTGAGSNYKGEARIGSNVNQVEVVEAHKFVGEHWVRGRRYDLVILPELAKGNEKIKQAAEYIVSGPTRGQVLYL